MERRSQKTLTLELRWSFVLAFLLGVCSISSPHLLSHAHAHHGTPLRASRSGNSSARSRTGSGDLSAEHENDAATALKFAPHTPSHADSMAAIVSATVEVTPRFTEVLPFTTQEAEFVPAIDGTPHLGRAPPVA